MSVPGDILGAVASNAGDEFHEVWALRAALSLLDRTSDLTALTVEGVASTESKPGDARQWDGVDCGLYFGGNTIESAVRIDLVQLKYSVSAPNKNWTLGRLVKNTSSKTNNSVARRLGNAFKAAAQGKGRRFVEDQIKISLVTNQPISASLSGLIEKILKGSTSQDVKILKDATGLSKKNFDLFCWCFKLRGDEAARSILKSNVIQKIASLTDTEVSGTLTDLRQTIREQMLPESSKHPIVRETVLAWFKVGDPLSLFPCESKLDRIADPIPRQVVSDLAEAVKLHPIVCLEGGGGCGKTTAGMSVESALPDGSKVVIFDCYGAGSYLDPSLSRHRPAEAFTQLSNDLAMQMQVPFLIPHKENPNISASFRRRLNLASEILAEDSPDGLLVVIVDAADNAVYAAKKSTPPEPCFVHDFIRIANLPDNVRFVVMARTSRLDSLKLPTGCFRVVCGPFELAETDMFVRNIWADATNDQIEQFHHLSNSIPRVQASTVSHVQNLEEALDFLRPNGKSLDDLFSAILRDSSIKMGEDGTLDQFCGALSVLSTPAPVNLLAELCGESEAFVSEVCDDLSPNVRMSPRGFEFANEDFENFVRETGESTVGTLRDEAASLLLSHRHTSDYAAIHLFDVLGAADRQQELFDIIEEEDSTRAIVDKVVRRRTDLRRLKSAVSIATAKGDAVQAGKTVLIGAEAVRTDSKVSNLIHNNIMLSTVFSETTIRQEILRVSDKRSSHGPVLTHLAKETATRPESLPLSREYIRMAHEWVNERSRIKGDYTHDWELNDEDIIALAYAVYKDRDWKGVINYCFGWSPDPLPITLLIGLVDLVLKRDGTNAIRDARSVLSPDIRWVSTVYLQRAGVGVSKTSISEELRALSSADLSNLEIGTGYDSDGSRGAEITSQLFFFVDICRHRSCSKSMITKLINNIWPPEQRPSSQTSNRSVRIDFTMRAEMALANLRNKPFVAKDAFQIKEDYEDDENNYQRKSDIEFLEQIGMVEKLYKTANNALSKTDKIQIQDALSTAATGLKHNAWRYEQSHNFLALRQVIGQIITDTQAICDLSIPETIKILKSISPKYNFFGQHLFQSFGRLLCNPAAFDPVVNVLQDYAKEAIDHVGPASGRAEALMEISKVILPNSPADAKAYFEQATQVVEEMDVEAIDQVYFLTRASVKFPHNTSTSRTFCADMAAIVEHTARVLEGEDEFPIEDVIESMATLSTPVAMCAVSQWTDVGLINTESYVRTLLKNLAALKHINPLITAALLLVADETGLTLTPTILATANSLHKTEKIALLEELSSRSILERQPENIKKSRAELNAFASLNTLKSATFDSLLSLCEFLERNKADIQTKTEDVSKIDERGVDGVSEDDPAIDFSDIDPTDPNAILSAIEREKSGGRYPSDELFDALISTLKPSDRTKYLDALSSLAKSENWPDRYIGQIVGKLDEWSGAAIQRWAASRLPQLIIDLGNWVFRYAWYEPDYFKPLIARTRLDSAGRTKLILAAIETNSEFAGSKALYRYAAELIQVLPDTDAEALFGWYLSRRKATQQRDNSEGLKIKSIDIENLPESIKECIPLFLYRYLGDVDARVRWRAAHAVRALVRLGQTHIVSKLIDCVDIDANFVFTAEDVPFHYLSAKLWLAMSLARIGYEHPSFIADEASNVLNIAMSGPPHLLIEMYIKRSLLAASKQVASISVSDIIIETLAAPIAGTVTIEDDYSINGLGSETLKDDLRFNFDSLDVLPYWYSPAAKVFADVTGEEFMKIADRWIVDEWGVDDISTHREKQPRRSRFSDGDYAMFDKRNGSYPVYESYSTYLQWHTMFVVVGELMQSRKIAEYKDDDYYNLDGWLRRWDTTYAICWLVDLRAPKPAKVKYWQPLPLEDDSWLEQIDNEIFYDELAHGENDDIVLYSWRDIKELQYGSSLGSEVMRVSSAFVPHDTAPGLLRALQTTEDNWDYHLVSEPDQDYDRRPNIEGFVMEPAFRRPMAHRDSGFDDRDPLSVGSSGIQAAPADKILNLLTLERSESLPVKWIKSGSKLQVAEYEAWAELADMTSDRELRQIAGKFSNGQILSINRGALLDVMTRIDMDLIFSVEIQRRQGDRYDRSKQKEAKESVFDRIYLFRRDGSFEDIDGHIGTG